MRGLLLGVLVVALCQIGHALRAGVSKSIRLGTKLEVRGRASPLVEFRRPRAGVQFLALSRLGVDALLSLD